MQTVSLVAQSLGQPAFVHDDLRVETSSGKYVVTLAHTPQEIDAALKLRFEVFNLELGEGLDSSFRTGRDRDQFDATCHHLIAADKTNGKVFGTYRLRTIEMAAHAEGFYSAGEFDLNCLPKGLLDQSVELGRACIAQVTEISKFSFCCGRHWRATFKPRESVFFLVAVHLPARTLLKAMSYSSSS